MAISLGPEGELHVLDIQQEMLDHTMRGASQNGIINLAPRVGDARALPGGWYVGVV